MTDKTRDTTSEQNPDPPAKAKPDLRAKDALKKEFAPGQSGEPVDVLFTPEEMDIYVNKISLESYIFHGKAVDYDSLDHLEYDPKDNTVDVVRKDGTRLDLGVKIQWLVRPYFIKSKEIQIIQTKNGKTVNGVSIPLIHKEKKSL